MGGGNVSPFHIKIELLITTGVVIYEQPGVSMYTANFLFQIKLSYLSPRKSLVKRAIITVSVRQVSGS